MIFLWFMTKFITFAQTHPSHLWSILLKSIYFSTNKYCMKCIMTNDRSSRPEVFCKKGGLTNSAKFIGRHLCQSLFLIKLQASGFIKKKDWHRCFPANFAKFLRTPFLTKHLRWLLLKWLSCMIRNIMLHALWQLRKDACHEMPVLLLFMSQADPGSYFVVDPGPISNWR